MYSLGYKNSPSCFVGGVGVFLVWFWVSVCLVFFKHKNMEKYNEAFI